MRLLLLLVLILLLFDCISFRVIIFTQLLIEYYGFGAGQGFKTKYD